jgi:hypothetical protein
MYVAAPRPRRIGKRLFLVRGIRFVLLGEVVSFEVPEGLTLGGLHVFLDDNSLCENVGFHFYYNKITMIYHIRSCLNSKGLSQS